MKNIIVVFGTRPEAVKMCPLVLELRKREGLRVLTVSTGQHGDMLSSALSCFGITPDYDLCVMKEGQTLFDITSRVMEGMRKVLEKEKCDLLLVHGDTSTAFAAALAAFYLRVPVGHVEAGLRTHDVYSPYPEEFNRVAVDALAQYHFAPTELAARRLREEGKSEESIFVTGNTVIDSFRYTVKEDFRHEALDFAGERGIVLLTAHRRESLGAPMEAMFRGVKRALEKFPQLCAVCPLHPNPSVRSAANVVFGGGGDFLLTDPLGVLEFHNLLARARLVITDSGGIQEEAPHFGVPVLVMRDVTERQEAVDAGTARLIGTREESVFRGICEVLGQESVYAGMARAENPYGDGHACERIADILEKTEFCSMA